MLMTLFCKRIHIFWVSLYYERVCSTQFSASEFYQKTEIDKMFTSYKEYFIK